MDMKIITNFIQTYSYRTEYIRMVLIKSHIYIKLVYSHKIMISLPSHTAQDQIWYWWRDRGDKIWPGNADIPNIEKEKN